MAWLHTWCGLTCAWLLCAIFLAGTLSVFREPITHWMRAAPVLPAVVAANDDVLSNAVRHLQSHAADSKMWGMELPDADGDALRLFWRTANSNQQAAIHPRDGSLLPAPWGRESEGGRHFMSFHYSLHAGISGFWVVGWISMCMLVALVSGVVTHKRIFKDFFTFRPGKGQRSWLDAHNVTAVLALPFLFMIVYTGLSIFYTSYMPFPLRAAYGSDDKAYSRFHAELSPENKLSRKATGEKAEMHALAPLIQQAQTLTGHPAQRILIERPGDSSMLIKVFGRAADDAESRRILNAAGSVSFDGVTGAVLDVKQPDGSAQASGEDAHRVMEQLHLAKFGGWGIKWLYFICGLAGTVMIATGSILFSVKRRKKSEMEFGAATARAYRWIEVLNIAAISGIGIACIGYFYANRLIPAAMANRSAWEIRVFFIVWLLSLLHATLRPPARAWIEQLSVTAMLCLALPVLNWLTTGEQVLSYIWRGDWEAAGVELTAIAFGFVLLIAAHKVRRKWGRS